MSRLTCWMRLIFRGGNSLDVIINQDGICKKSDKDIVWGALMAKCRQLERTLEKRYLSQMERLAVRDEYERTFALTEKYRRDS